MNLAEAKHAAYNKLPDGRTCVVHIPEGLGVPDDVQGEGAEQLSGRELDAAVAARVFGYTVEWRSGKRTQVKDPVYLQNSGSWLMVPNYSEGQVPAATLELRLEFLGWRQDSPPRDPHVTLIHSDGRTVSATGESAYEAFSRAAVKAVAL